MKQTFSNIYFYLICALALVLSLHSRFVPPLIILLTASSFFLFDKGAFKRNITFYFIAGLYVLYALGLFYTHDAKAGRFDLEVKLSMLALPLACLPLFTRNFISITTLGRWFVVGTVVAVMINLGLATYNYFYEKWLIANHLYNLDYGINFFLSSRFSFFQHPSYFSLYLSLALVFILFDEHCIPNKKLRTVLALFVLLGMILSASKAGIIGLVLIVALFILIQKKYKMGLYLIGGLLVSFGTLYMYAPEFANKFIGMSKAVNTDVDSTAIESSASRVLVWKTAIDLISESPVAGYGTGDVNSVLCVAYKEKGYTAILEKKLNAHNQFLQTYLAIGLAGFLVLTTIIVCGGFRAAYRKQWIACICCLLLLVNCMFESMLETQAGVVFFAFWLSVFGMTAVFPKSSNFNP